MLNPYSKLQSRKRGWSNILLEEHGSQEAERAFENHELESNLLCTLGQDQKVLKSLMLGKAMTFLFKRYGT
nr:hypothetical protein CFP56_73216 [Quercus suber]